MNWASLCVFIDIPNTRTMKALFRNYCILVLAILIIGIPVISLAQNMNRDQKGLYSKGLKQFKKDNYMDALPMFQELIQSCSDNLDVNRYLAECLFFVNRPGEAITYYEHARFLITGDNNSGENSSNQAIKPYNRSLLTHINSRLADCHSMASESAIPASGPVIPPSPSPPPPPPVLQTQNVQKAVEQNTNTADNENSLKPAQFSSNQVSFDYQTGIIEDKTQHLKFKFYAGNPSSLTTYILENQDESWKIPSEAEVINLLKNLISSRLVDDPFFKPLLFKDAAPLLTSDFEYDQGDKQYHCFYINGMQLRKIRKESIDEVNILLKQ